tara:strand:+ start:4774 stop:5214 length:441 start_codon:yes stop_codon:yes gene_type:complete
MPLIEPSAAQQALLVALLMLLLYYAVHSVKNAPLKEGLTNADSSKQSGQTLQEKLVAGSTQYDSMIDKDAKSHSARLAILSDAQRLCAKAQLFMAMNALGDQSQTKSMLEQAPGLVAIRECIDQAIKDVGSGLSDPGNGRSGSSKS